jgi:hypothetical protein
VAVTGGDTVFVVPGQKYGYPVTNAHWRVNTGPGEICQYLYFCTFAKASFEGNESKFYTCGDSVTNNNNGSWKNDQTPGVKATLYIYNSTVHKYGVYTTAPAYSNDAHWTSGVAIYKVDPC